MNSAPHTAVPAGVELAVGYLLADPDFRAFADRARDGVVRARVSDPLLPLLVAGLWRSRASAEPRGLAVLVEDDDAARALADEVAAFLPADRWRSCPRAASITAAASTRCPTWSASGRGG